MCYSASMSLDFHLENDQGEPLAHFNITHNLNIMADEAGIYECLWRPEEQDPPITTAAQCVPLLQAGLTTLKAGPHKFRLLSAKNGWGTYEQFVPWVEEVLAACEANPDAFVSASR
jgi:hypothetical protein